MMLLERVAGAVPVSISFTQVSNTLEADSQGASLLTHCRRLARANFGRANGRDAEKADLTDPNG